MARDDRDDGLRLQQRIHNVAVDATRHLQAARGGCAAIGAQLGPWIASSLSLRADSCFAYASSSSSYLWHIVRHEELIRGPYRHELPRYYDNCAVRGLLRKRLGENSISRPPQDPTTLNLET